MDCYASRRPYKLLHKFYLDAGEALYVIGSFARNDTKTVSPSHAGYLNAVSAHCKAEESIRSSRSSDLYPLLLTNLLVQIVNTNGNCMGDAYDWLVSFMFFLGDLCWLPAVYCMMLEAINKDFKER